MRVSSRTIRRTSDRGASPRELSPRKYLGLTFLLGDPQLGAFGLLAALVGCMSTEVPLQHLRIAIPASDTSPILGKRDSAQRPPLQRQNPQQYVAKPLSKTPSLSDDVFAQPERRVGSGNV